MALKKYDVTIDGHKTTLLLSDEDARREGLLKDEQPAPKKAAEKQAPKPANKARKAPNKSKG